MCSKWLLVFLLLAVVCLSLPLSAHAAPSRPYILRHRIIAGGTPQERIVRMLYRRSGKRPIWTRTVTDLDYLAWSRDGRAFIADVGPWNPFHSVHKVNPGGLFYWREGRSPRTFYSRRFDENDYFYDLQISPDGRLAAFCAGGSGEMDIHVGPLFLFDLARNRLVSGPGEAAKMEWVNSRTLKYWVYKSVLNVQGGMNGPYLWHFAAKHRRRKHKL